MSSDTVEIQDPPLEAIEKKHSCVRRSCVTGCGCFLFVILGAAALVAWNARPNVKTYKTPPDIVPTDLPLYDKDSIDSITYTAGKPAQPLLDGAVVGAKIILSPLVYLRDRYIPSLRSENDAGVPTSTSFTEAVYNYVTTSPAPVTDQVVIDWQGLSAMPNFIMDYYSKELKKRGYTITEKNGSDDDQALFFARDTLRGALEIKNNPLTPGTDLLRLTLTFLPS